MRSPLFLLISTAITTLLVFPSTALEPNNLAQINSLTTEILQTMGYDCNNAGAAVIACKKCQDNNLTEDCEVYMCDSVTKKCRKQNAEIPKLPGSGIDTDTEERPGRIVPSL